MRAAALLLPITLIPAAAAPQSGNGPAVSGAGARVTVSRQELRVVFPPDTASTWGWSDRSDPRYDARYTWSVAIDGFDGPRRLEMAVRRTEPKARRFPSLDSLVASATSSFCPPRKTGVCPTPAAALSVSGRQVVLTYGDSITIARTFALRPATVSVMHWSPSDSLPVGETVQLEYIAPEIPQPNAATLAESARARHASEASTRRIMRVIDGGPEPLGALWLVLGDSALQMVAELSCQTHTCTSLTFDADVAWTVDDSSVVASRVVAPKSVDADSSTVIIGQGRASALMVTGRRLGRTTLRAQLGASPSDTMPSRTPPSRAPVREVHVIPPVARVELTAPSTKIRAGDQAEFRVRAFDESGGRIAGVPIAVEFAGGYATTTDQDGRVRHVLSAGSSTVIARFFHRADTVVVTVDNRKPNTPSGRH